MLNMTSSGQTKFQILIFFFLQKIGNCFTYGISLLTLKQLTIFLLPFGFSLANQLCLIMCVMKSICKGFGLPVDQLFLCARFCPPWRNFAILMTENYCNFRIKLQTTRASTNIAHLLACVKERMAHFWAKFSLKSACGFITWFTIIVFHFALSDVLKA